MKKIKSIFENLSSRLIQDVKTKWDEIIYNSTIYDDNCKMKTQYKHGEDIEYLKLGFDNTFEISDITISLRDIIFQETGKRIWGFTFTLYPDGKHEIEYDYNIPEGFNENGEWIGDDHKNEAVSEFFDNIRKIGTDEFELK